MEGRRNLNCWAEYSSTIQTAVNMERNLKAGWLHGYNFFLFAQQGQRFFTDTSSAITIKKNNAWQTDLTET